MAMEYISETLGIDIKRTRWSPVDSLPYYLSEAYLFEAVELDSVRALFARPLRELGRINDVAMQVRTLSRITDLPVVLELNQIHKPQRDALIRHGLAFVVQGKQLYLPFLGLHLQERFSAKRHETVMGFLSPAEQVVLFSFIYNRNEPLRQKDLVERLNYSAMSISRAGDLLVQKGLLTRENVGVNRIFTSSAEPQALFLQAKPYLINPVRRTIYIDHSIYHDSMFPAGLSALSAISDLSPPFPAVWGTAENAQNYARESKLLVDATKQIALELWKYDPLQLSGRRQIDPLSLVMSLEGHKDERIQAGIQEILESAWKQGDKPG